MVENKLMVSVTRQEFFAALNADPRDIMPNTRHEDRSEWRDRNGNLFGVTRPGWKYPRESESYELSREPCGTEGGV